MSTEALNAVLQNVVDRSISQKEMRLAAMREELVELGYSVVSTEWLNAVIRENPVAGIATKQNDVR